MDNQVLLNIARDTIKSRFDKTIKVDKEKLLKDYPFLNEPTATFVTLNLKGQLRGCIGTLEARHKLIDDLVANANNAAFHDPRFYELSKEEFENIELEISLLTKPVKIEYEDISELKSKIKPFVHGVILEDGLRRSTFLPQVWEQLPNFDEFFMHLCHKGNFELDCLKSHPNVYIYEVNKVK